MNRLAAWYAIALRAGSAIIYAIVGPLAATDGVSAGWLIAALGILTAWSVIFALVVARIGLAWPVVAADVFIIVVLVGAQSQVVPAGSIKDGTSWVLPLASTSVFIAQLAWRPAAGLPAAGALTISYLLSAPQAGHAWILPLQAVITAALMLLVRRGGRKADATIDAGRRAEEQQRAEAARQADDREAYRQLHDTILSTLTMVASGAFAGPSAILSAQAARDLDVLRPQPVVPAGGMSLLARLELVAAASPAQVGLCSATVKLPAAVIEQIAACVAEALRNVVRHAGVLAAVIKVSGGDGWVDVEVIDQGCGFDLEAVPASRRGLRESISGRMVEAGGAAVISSQPGHGTTVLLRWPR